MACSDNNSFVNLYYQVDGIDKRMERIESGQQQILGVVMEQSGSIGALCRDVRHLHHSISRHDSELGALEQMAQQALLRDVKRDAVNGALRSIANAVWSARKVLWPVAVFVGGGAALRFAERIFQ